MPRKRTQKGHRFRHGKRRLPGPLRMELLSIAGIPEDDRAAPLLIEEVEEALSEAMDFRDSVDRGPSAAEQAKLLGRVESAASALERALLELDQGSLMSIGLAAFVDAEHDLPRVEDLVALRDAAKRERERCLGQKRTGRPIEQARDMAMEELARAFRKRARVGKNYAYELQVFVGTALRAAGFAIEKRAKERGSSEKAISDKVRRRIRADLRTKGTT